MVTPHQQSIYIEREAKKKTPRANSADARQFLKTTNTEIHTQLRVSRQSSEERGGGDTERREREEERARSQQSQHRDTILVSRCLSLWCVWILYESAYIRNDYIKSYVYTYHITQTLSKEHTNEG